MKPLSIRAGLISWFVGLTTLLLIAFSGTLYYSTSRALRSGLDDRLETAARGFVALCEWEEDIGTVEFEVSEELAAQVAAGYPERSFEVRTWPDGRLLYRFGEELAAPAPGAAPEGTAPEPGLAAAHDTIENKAGRRRLVTVIAHSPAVPADILMDEPAKPAFSVMVRVADSLAPVEARLSSLTWFVAVFASVSAVVVVVFGILLSRRVVRPLRELGEAAARVRAGDAVRLPRRGAGDEVDELANHLEDAFLRLEEALQRQTRFTSDAAHELRNPITVIQNAAEVALRRERPGEDYRMFLEDVLATSKRMGGVVEALLFLARIDAGTLKATFDNVDLAAIAEDSAAAQLHANGRVEIDAPNPAMVKGDEGLLRVLIDNILSNALRYSDTDSKVDVAVQNGENVVISVRDRGPGIPDAAVERVFDRFFRVESANPDAPGAGLGLAIVAEIVRVHTAQTEIDTSPDGTTVSVLFPKPAD
jgi:signal transduction histidine kinase